MAVLTLNFRSLALGRNVDLTAIVPLENADFYGVPLPQDEEKPLKTLYLLHGVLDDHSGWVKNTRIAMWAQDANLAVIMPSGENGFYLDQIEAQRNYGQFIGEELPTVMERLLHLSNRREDRYIGGLSMGGFGALRNGLKYADKFSHIMALSSALVYDQFQIPEEEAPFPFQRRSFLKSCFGPLEDVKGSDMDVYQLVADLVAQGKSVPKIFQACGTEDTLFQANEDFHKHLEALGVEHTFIADPGVHSWYYWDEHVKMAIDDFFPLYDPNK